MFGIDQISWAQFIRFILAALSLWYLAVGCMAWLKEKSRNQKLFFEEDYSTPALAENTCPISVSSQDYPAELIPYRLAENIPLPVSLYEETGIDDGYPIECFSEPNGTQLSKILKQVQFQK